MQKIQLAIGLIAVSLTAQTALAQVSQTEVDAAKSKNADAEWIDPAILNRLQNIKSQKPMSAIRQQEVLNTLKDRGATLLSNLDGASMNSVQTSTAGKELPEMQGLDPNQPVVIAKGITRVPIRISGYPKPLYGLEISVVVDANGNQLRTRTRLPDTGYVGTK